jgi:hypothetical protein
VSNGLFGNAVYYFSAALALLGHCLLYE